ncbi:MAG: ATP-binding protein [Chloroflexi bacterium]|nr:ATP-binding protein [Chloroflexota bacterium]
MIDRDMALLLRKVAREQPVVTLSGPRQSGKTTLCKAAFPDKPYVTLEDSDAFEFADTDPKGFLAQFPRGAILDEVQNVPRIFSQLQVLVDDQPKPGQWILTGSQELEMSARASQSLAGRTGVLTLLPPSWAELQRFPRHPKSLHDVLWKGAYPRIHNRRLDPARWLAAYVRTYIERDVRRLLKVTDLLTFQTFLKMCAARAGQLLNLAGLAADCGITQPTAKSWMSVLEASFIVFRLPPFHRNWGKRLVKAPKLYFHDSGLLCWLLGIRESAALRHHALRGAVFESWVASEIVKARRNRGLEPDLMHYRDRSGMEVDLVLERGENLTAIEVKSGETVSSDFFKNLETLKDLAHTRGNRRHTVERIVIYGGSERQTREQGRLMPWRAIDEEDWS